MKMRFILVILFTMVLMGSAFATYEFDPTDIGVGARPLGMGKAFVGLSDDGSAVFTNAAGLTGKDEFRLISMAGNLFDEIPYTVIGGSFKALDGVVGVGFVGVTATGIIGTELVGNTPEATGEEGNYSNTAVVLAYSTTGDRVPLIQGVQLFNDINLRVGTSLKIISEGFSGGDAFDGRGSGFDLDVSSMFDVTEDITGGLVVKNLIPGDNIRWKDSSNELAMSIIPGINWKLRNVNVGIDAEIIEAKGLYWHVGTEWWPVEYFALRLGIDQKPSAGEISNNFSAGLGTRYEGFTFDYAYHAYEDVSEFTTHYFSIGFMGPGLDK